MVVRARALISLLALGAMTAGCPPSREAADARSQALHADNLAAQKRAVAQISQKEGLTLRYPAPETFILDRLHSSCGSGAEQFELTSQGAKPLVVNIPCKELPDMRRTLWGKLQDGTSVVLIGADRSDYRVRGLDDSSSPGKVTVVTATPNFVRDEEIVYPGSCNLMPSPEPDNMPRAFVVLRDRAHQDIRFLPAPYDAVRIRRSCEDPAY